MAKIGFLCYCLYSKTQTFLCDISVDYAYDTIQYWDYTTRNMLAPSEMYKITYNYILITFSKLQTREKIASVLSSYVIIHLTYNILE